jgi:hypothetical protein
MATTTASQRSPNEFISEMNQATPPGCDGNRLRRLEEE